MSSTTQTSITISINGEPKCVPAGSSVASLLNFLEIAGDRVAVELEKNIVRKRDWPTAAVHEGAQIEIVEFVGGG